MFEVGFTEIVLILGIALLVLGPERLPKLAADIGRWAGRARSMARQLRTQLEQEAHYDPLRESPSPAATTPPPASPPAPDGTRAVEPEETDASKPQ
jgi:Tat protein translocase TatB subunit